MNLRSLVICLAALSFASCGSKKRVVTKKPNVIISESSNTKEFEGLPSVNENEHIRNLENSGKKLNKNTLSYIKKYAPIAVSEMHTSRIPASITLAQGILESGNGKSQLASKSNNHFGIKCHTGWEGKRVYHDDDEKGECFRKYQYVATSFKDHSDFLSKRRRYAFLFNYSIRDYKKWARGLKKAGYATDKRYPRKLIGIIENYNLYKFDAIGNGNLKIPIEVEEKVIIEPPVKTTVTSYHEVKKGDTLYSLARKFNTSVDALKLMNDLKNNNLSIGQILLVKISN